MLLMLMLILDMTSLSYRWILKHSEFLSGRCGGTQCKSGDIWGPSGSFCVCVPPHTGPSGSSAGLFASLAGLLWFSTGILESSAGILGSSVRLLGSLKGLFGSGPSGQYRCPSWDFGSFGGILGSFEVLWKTFWDFVGLFRSFGNGVRRGT